MKNRLIFYGTILFLFIFPSAWDFSSYGARLFAVGLFALVGFLWIASLIRAANYTVNIPRITIPITALLLVHTLLYLRSTQPFFEIHWVLYDLVFLLVIWFVVDSARTGWRVRIWEEALIFAGFFFSFIDLIYLISWYWRWWQIAENILELPPVSIRSPGLLLGSPNTIAAYINLLIPLLFVRIWRPTRPALRYFWGALLLYFLAILFFTTSRTAWLGLLGSMLVLLTLLLRPTFYQLLSRKSQPIRPQKIRRSWRLPALVVLLVGMAIVPMIVRQVRLSWHGSLGHRIDIWQFALGLIRSKPLLGHGAGGVAFQYALRSQSIGGDEVFHAHNLWLQVAAGAGIVGLALLIWAIFYLLRAQVSAWQETMTESPARLSLIAYAGIGAAILVQSMFDFSFWRLPYTLAVAVILGLVYHFAPPKEFLQVRSKIFILALALLFLLGSTGAFYMLRGNRAYNEGQTFAKAGDWKLAQQKVCQAVTNNPQNSFYKFQCALASAKVAVKPSDVEWLEAALQMQKLAITDDPYWYLHWANLSVLEWKQDQRQAALEHMYKAVEMAPKQAFLWVDLGWMEERLGDHESALVHYHKAYCLNRAYEDSLFFAGSELRQQAKQGSCPDNYALWEPYTVQRFLWQSEQAYKAGDYMAAEQYLQAAIAQDPDNGDAYIMLALIHQETGQSVLAWKEVQTAFLVSDPGVRSLLVAAQVVQAQEKMDLAMRYRAEAFKQIQHPYFSYHYYFQAYRALGLLTDVSPFLPQLGISLEMVQDFQELAHYYTEQGEQQQAQEVLNWLQKNTQW
jgi:O-antigen ligase/tetratricopeptide (TPR) repeat protein